FDRLATAFTHEVHTFDRLATASNHEVDTATCLATASNHEVDTVTCLATASNHEVDTVTCLATTSNHEVVAESHSTWNGCGDGRSRQLGVFRRQPHSPHEHRCRQNTDAAEP